jgi:hypothetical protein
MYMVAVTDQHGESLGLRYWRNFMFDLSGNISRYGCKSSRIIDSLKEYNCVYDFESSDCICLIFNTKEDFVQFKLVWS